MSKKMFRASIGILFMLGTVMFTCFIAIAFTFSDGIAILVSCGMYVLYALYVASKVRRLEDNNEHQNH